MPDFLGQWSIRLAFSQSRVILVVFWVIRPQNPLSVRDQKNLFCVNFGQEWHLPPQHPGIDLKLSSKGKPGTCALLEILPSPVDFFRRAKLLGLLDKFCILPTYFYKF
jgi:hypothetical protein